MIARVERVAKRCLGVVRTVGPPALEHVVVVVQVVVVVHVFVVVLVRLRAALARGALAREARPAVLVRVAKAICAGAQRSAREARRPAASVRAPM
jgi:hypothetical protein